MRRKKATPKITFKCTACGHEPEENKDKSNENWKVYDTVCAKCGGKVEMDIDWDSLR